VTPNDVLHKIDMVERRASYERVRPQ